MKKLKDLLSLMTFLFGALYGFSQIQLGNDIDGLMPDDRFGIGVSSSSDGTIVAIVGFSGNSTDGRIRVFKYIGDTWTLYGTDVNGENFGGVGAFSVSLSADGHTLAFGRLGNIVSVYSFDTTSGIWSPKGNDIANTTSVGNFGYSIKLSSDGNIIAIGTPDSPIVPDSGVTQIFQFEMGSWTQVGADIIGLNAAENSGRSVDLSSNGDIVAILNDNSARVYQNISDTWTLLGNDIAEEGNQIPNRAVSLSSDGQILAIGEPDFSDSLIQRGRVRVFNYDAGVWTQIGNTINGEIAYYRTGSSVSLSADGQMLAIGEIGSTSGSTDAGRTRIFENQNGSWVQIGDDIYGEASLDHSGGNISLSASGSSVIIGASLNDGGGTDSGHARVYDLSNLLAVNDIERNDIVLYPNPANSTFTIQLQASTTLKNITIYNSLGKMVLSKPHQIIDVSNLASGIYYVQIKTDISIRFKKIVIH